MPLWIAWFDAVRALRPASRRFLTFLWMILVLVGLSCRPERAGVTSLVRLFGFGNRGYRRFLHLFHRRGLDLAGVTSYVRVLGLHPEAYYHFLHLFHSKGLDLDKLTACWVKLCLTLFKPVCAGSRLVCLADGIRAPKEGKLMPAVKSLHQQSASNSKPGSPATGLRRWGGSRNGSWAIRFKPFHC
jgi:hypothetical protein